MFIPYLNGIRQGPGFPSEIRAEAFFKPLMQVHRALRSILTIAFSEKAKDGARAKYYDWDARCWIRVPYDQNGVLITLRQKKTTPPMRAP